MNLIGSFQIFESIVVLTRGGPGDSSRSVTYYMWEKGFQSFDLGYASAISLALGAVILVVTLLQFALRRTWVHYE